MDIDGLAKILEDHDKDEHAHWAKVETALFGDPKTGVLGFAIRLDRLEQIEIARRWHIRTLWATVWAAIMGLFVSTHWR